ncbi:TPA: ParB/RepB/Spo0J family partition protein [Candidatus Saccharibacteria bacterium]|nr:ParB/RepB/Spo0J family partition protein [Candidatus Saccharibacteria bacterium]HIO87210.1 ParB/RepB/Spo0J family partition protein [Candidatus Saccharibacteria bacterium]
MAKTKGLGRGLESLIPTEVIQEQIQASRNTGVQEIDLAHIVPNPHQPRTNFKPEAIDELAQSLEQHGLVQPVVVIKNNNEFQLIAGERRVRAAKQLKWKTIPALVRTADEQQQLELALVENIHRDDLNPLEIAASYIKLVELFGLEVVEVAEKAGKAESTVRNIIRLLNLPQEAKDALTDKVITEGHARQILALKDPKKQQELLSLIKKHDWSVRQTEMFTKRFKTKGSTKEVAAKRTLSETPQTKKLSQVYNRTVRIQRTAKGGRLMFEFKNESDLKKLTKRLAELE